MTVADNGRFALDRIATQSFDVILMDMMMPVMDGLEATRHIRQSEGQSPQMRHVPIIAMTANAMESDRQRCLEAGMDDFISKPINAIELQQKLQHLVLETPMQNLAHGAAAATESVREAASGFDYGNALAGVDQEVVGIIAQAFVDQWPTDLQKMQAGLACGDAQQVMHVVHALKGTLSTFGARPASALAHRMEVAANLRDLGKVSEDLPALIAEVEQLITALGVAIAS